MFSSFKKNESEKQTDNPYWLSFSDMMSGILIIFILVCMTLLYQLIELKNNYRSEIMREIEDKYNKNSKIRQSILQDIAKELAEQGVRVFIEDNKTVLRIPEDSLHFDVNKSEIKDELKANAWKIGKALHNGLTKNERWKHLETIFIEGHTDGKQVKSIPRFNWDLSTERAVSLWQFWLHDTEYGDKLKNLSNKDDSGTEKPLFSVSGYADTRRVEDIEKTEDDAKKNRRIDIRFTTRQPVLEELESWEPSYKEMQK